MYILHFFTLCRGLKGGGGMAQCPPNAPLDVHALIVTAYWSQFETIQEVFSKGVV